MIAKLLKYIPTLLSIRSRAARLRGSLTSTTTKDQAQAVAISALAVASLQEVITIDQGVAGALVQVLVWVGGLLIGPAIMRMRKYVEAETQVEQSPPATTDPVRDKVRADAYTKAKAAIEANKKPDLVMLQFRGGAPVWLRDPIPWADALNAGYDLGRDARGVIHELWKELEAGEKVQQMEDAEKRHKGEV